MLFLFLRFFHCTLVDARRHRAGGSTFARARILCRFPTSDKGKYVSLPERNPTGRIVARERVKIDRSLLGDPTYESDPAVRKPRSPLMRTLNIRYAVGCETYVSAEQLRAVTCSSTSRGRTEPTLVTGARLKTCRILQTNPLRHRVRRSWDRYTAYKVRLSYSTLRTVRRNMFAT